MSRLHLVGLVGAMLLAGGGRAPASAGEAVTAGELVGRCAAALGGREAIDAVTTLRFTVAYPGKAAPVVTEIKRPHRIRSEAGYVLVFDGARAAFLKGAPAPDGIDPGPQLVRAADSRDFEADIAFLFPAFFDYPAQYLGTEGDGPAARHRLAVALPGGIRMIYLIDAQSCLPRQVIAEVPVDGEVYRARRELDDYAPAAGVLWPRSFTSIGWGDKGRASVVSVEVNIPLDDGRFAIPAEAAAAQ